MGTMTATEDTIRIVSITPLAVERDSRTFKQAASMARFGYTSIVVEGERSNLDRANLPFELLSLEDRPTRHASVLAAGSGPTRARSAFANLFGRLKQLPFRVSGVRFAYDQLYWHGVRTLLHTPKASLYYLHAFNQFPAVYLLSRIHHAPYIYDAHDFYPRIYEAEDLDVSRRFLAVPLQRWLEARCVKHAAAVVTVGEGIAELQQQAFGRRGVVVRNCDDPRLNMKPAHGLRDALGLSEEEFLLVVIGHAKKGQALPEMLEALAHLPSNVHVALLGMGYEQYQTHIQDLKLRDRVHIVPPVKPFEVVPFIESADASLILYYPRSINYLNCLPNGFFQAIASGLPLLYPELPELRNIAEQYHLGLPIDPLSPESIRAAVTELIRNTDRLAEYKKNARLAGQMLSWEREERILSDLLHHTLNSAQGARG